MPKPPLSSTSNGPHSSAFFTFEKQAASLNDLDIVRKIAEREGCLEALAQLLTTANKTKGPTTSTEIDQVYPYTYPRRGTITSSTSSSSSTASPMVVHSLLDQLRSVSIQIVEAIEQWRAITQMQVFQWRQINYLLKMTTDLNFLATAAVHVDALQQLQRLKCNPFFAPLHLNHPALHEKVPDAAIQLGVYMGNVDMKRVFFASKVLVRELEMERKRQLMQKQQQGNSDDDEDDSYGTLSPMNNTMAVVDSLVLTASKHQPQQGQQQMRVRWSNQDVKGSSVSSLSSPYQAKQSLLLGSDSSTAELLPRDRKEEMGRDLELCRELILHAEHELGAIREEVAILQEKLADALARPERRRKLQNKIGTLINALKFKSGDLYQRKNELRQKEAVYRLQCERNSAGSSSSGKLGRVDKLTSSQRASFSGAAADQCENGRRSPVSSQNLYPYLSAVESAMQEDELQRQEIVEKFMTLTKMRAVAAASSTSRQKHKQLLTKNASHPSPSFKPQATIGSFSPHSQGLGWHLMTTDEVASFIDSLDLGCSYGAKFRSQGIDGALLLQANDQDLEEIGVAIRLHRVRILEAIKSLKASR